MNTYTKFITVILLVFVNVFSANSQSFDFLPSTTNNQLIEHSYYTLSYVEKYEQAEWVAYEFIGERFLGVFERTNDFRIDTSVISGSSELSDYISSGYDRGHLVPAADMSFSDTAMSESFFLSNVSPQNPSFNRGVWKKLEGQLRVWASENEHLYIVSGGVLSSCSLSIGANKVGVPEYFYKVILDYTFPDIKAIAFVLPNERGMEELDFYVTSIDDVEQMTGLDFFPALPDEIEEDLEKLIDKSKWNWK